MILPVSPNAAGQAAPG